jgi:hypothetical protein
MRSWPGFSRSREEVIGIWLEIVGRMMRRNLHERAVEREAMKVEDCSGSLGEILCTWPPQ